MEVTTEEAAIPVPGSRFCSDEIPAADRFAIWSDSIAPLARPYLAPGVTREGFSVTTDAFLLDTVFLAITEAFGVGGCHKPESSPRQDAPEVFMVHYFLSGKGSGYNAGYTFRFTSGDILILDPTRELSLVKETSFRFISLVVSRELMSSVLDRTGRLRPRVIRGSSLPGRILGHAMRATALELPNCSLADAKGLSRLLIGAISGMMEGGSSRPDDPAVDQATIGAICDYIQRNLSLPDLGPDHLCKRFHCSRARLYRLFAPLDGVANYIRRARLERCRAALLAGSRKATVSEIALQWGFGNISNFTRLFRKTYGAAPREVRDGSFDSGAASSTAPNPPVIWIPEYQRWLENF